MIRFLYELLYVLSVALGAASLLIPAVGMGAAAWPGVLAVVLLAGALTAFRNTGWTARMIMAGVAAAVVSAILLLSRIEAIHEILMDHTAALWLPVIAAGAFAVGEGIAQFRPLRLVLSAAALLSLIVCAARHVSVDKLFVTAALAVILLSVTEEVQRSWPKSGYTDQKAHLVYVAPFLLAAILLVAVSPAPEDAYDWAFVKRIWERTGEAIRDLNIRISLGNFRDPSESMMGFSGRGGIYGRIREDNAEVMELSEITSGITTLKLTGRTFDTFDGREWTDNDPSGLPDVTLDTISLLSSVEERTDVPEDLIRKTSMHVRYLKINTACVFAPLKAIASGSALTEARVYEESGDLLWPGTKSYRTEYTIPFYRINTDHDVFRAYLRSAEMPSRESFEPNAIMYAAKGAEGYSYEDLIRHREHIYECYGQPVTVSETLRAYLDDYYGDAESCDRMEMLEELLKSLKYTDQPGELPRRVDSDAAFLDYFLRESREGYCSHFATAFVLLARAEGIPARYVQGYIVPVKGVSSVTVDSSMAHAWPEVYYDGAGWIAYEPTPIYGVTSYWSTEEELQEAAAGKAPAADRTGPEELTDPLPEPEEEETHRIVIPWYAVVIPFAAGILVAALLIAIGRMIARARFRRMDPRERFISRCRRDLYLLKQLDLGIEGTETLREYGSRIAEDAGEENTRFLSYLESCLYEGRPDLTEGERTAEETGKRLSERLRKEHPIRGLLAMTTETA